MFRITCTNKLATNSIFLLCRQCRFCGRYTSYGIGSCYFMHITSKFLLSGTLLSFNKFKYTVSLFNMIIYQNIKSAITSSGSATAGVYSCVQLCIAGTISSVTIKCCQTNNCNTPSKAALLQANKTFFVAVSFLICSLVLNFSGIIL